MAICAVFNCGSNNDKRLKRKQEESVRTQIKFFKFPKDKVISNIWLQKCKRKDKINKNNAYIWSKHFNSDHYLRNMQHELLQYSSKSCKKLKSDAVPTENLPGGNVQMGESLREKRQAKKNKIKILSDIFKSSIQTFEQSEPTEVIIAEEICTTDSKKYADKVTITDSVMEHNISKALEIEILELRAKNTELQKECHFLREENKCISKIFTPTQKCKMRNSGKRIKWTADDISKSIAIYANGPKAYRFLLKQKYPLPAVITLKSWATKIDINPGFLRVVFNLLDKCNLTSYQRVCTLMADEMKIKKSYEYDQKSDILHAPANYVQVLMVRGLFENWKQPIYYDYDTQLSKGIINSAIRKLNSINFNVVAVVSDLGGGNRGLWNQLGINEMHPYFDNPCDNSKKVYVFNDVPHLIKLFRNHFLDSGILMKNNILLTKAPLVDLYEQQKCVDLKIASRLTPMHLNCKFGYRQKVKYATQLFSNTNSQALTRLGVLGLAREEHWKELAILLKNVNDWFDVFNSKVPRIDTRPRMAAYGLSMLEHDRILNEMEQVTREMRIGKKQTLLPFQKGIINNITALKMLYADLKEQHKISYLLTYRLNQDPLEMFFGMMRAKGGLFDHPTALQFKYRLRSFLLGRNQSIMSEHGNVQCDETKNVQMEIDLTTVDSIKDNSLEDDMMDVEYLSEEFQCDAESVTSNLLKDLEIDDCTTNEQEIDLMSDLAYDGLEHLAGYLIYRLHNKIPNMLQNYCDTDTSTWTWTNQLSEGGLKKPNLIFMRRAAQLEEIFNTYNSNSLQVGRNYIKNLLKLAEKVELDVEIKKLFFRCKLFFKIRILNSEITENTNSKKRKFNKTIN